MAEQVAKKDADRSLNLYQKLAAITGEVGVIAKDGKNTEQNFAFIEYASVAGKLRELFSKYGVIVVPRMKHTQDRKVVTSKYGKEGVWTLVDMSFNVVNADAPEDRFTVTWTGEAMDYGDKATNKAATSALKYYLMRQFNISEKGDDPDEHSPGEQRAAASKQEAPEPLINADPAEAEPTDDQWDLLYELGRRLKWSPKMARINFEKIKTTGQADSLTSMMEARLETMASRSA